MAQYNSFEDLPTWKESRLVANTICELSSEGSFATDDGLRDQIRRAAISKMSNIADGVRQHRNGPRHRRLPAAQRKAFVDGGPHGRIGCNDFDRESNREFVSFLSIAKTSLAKVRLQLFLALDLEYVTPENHSETVKPLKKLGAEISGLMRDLEQTHRPSDR